VIGNCLVDPGDECVTTIWGGALNLGGPKEVPKIHRNSNLFPGPSQTTKMLPKVTKNLPNEVPNPP
jgi:hypothetical protein